MTNIKRVSDSYLCSNCGACGVICPKGSISFTSSKLGRMYAQVKDSCIGCGLCLKVCPTIDTLCLHEKYEDKYLGQIKHTYIARANDEVIYRNAQSGGLATALLSYLFKSGRIDAALVCQMSEGVRPIVTGKIVVSTKELYPTQKSIYTPIDLLTTLSSAKDYKSIAVVGLPCHIQGVCHLMESPKSLKNVKYKIGLVCDRTLCAGIQNVFASCIKEDKMRIVWRKKDFISKNGTYYSYDEAPVVIENSSGLEHIIPNINRHALKEMFTSPRCRVCYDKLNTHSDIVLGDPWGMDGVDKIHGDSLVITRTEMGQQLLDEVLSDNEISLSEQADNTQALSGQAIEGRRKSVQVYSRVFSVLQPSIQSYMLELCDEGVADKVKEKKAVDVLLKFKQRELLDDEKILLEAFGEIDRYKKIIQHNNSIIANIRKKLKRILKK